jgi:hypothetical protein
MLPSARVLGRALGHQRPRANGLWQALPARWTMLGNARVSDATDCGTFLQLLR